MLIRGLLLHFFISLIVETARYRLLSVIDQKTAQIFDTQYLTQHVKKNISQINHKKDSRTRATRAKEKKIEERIVAH